MSPTKLIFNRRHQEPCLECLRLMLSYKRMLNVKVIRFDMDQSGLTNAQRGRVLHACLPGCLSGPAWLALARPSGFAFCRRFAGNKFWPCRPFRWIWPKSFPGISLLFGGRFSGSRGLLGCSWVVLGGGLSVLSGVFRPSPVAFVCTPGFPCNPRLCCAFCIPYAYHRLCNVRLLV